MAFNWRKLFYPVAGDLFTPHLHIKQLADSASGIIPAANSADANAIYAAAVAAGVDPAVTPVLVDRVDTGRVARNAGTGWVSKAAAAVAAAVGPTAAAAELTLASCTLVGDGATAYRVDFTWYNITRTVTSDSFLIRLYDGASQIAQAIPQFGAAEANLGSGIVRGLITPSAGEHTITARLVRNIGTGTATLAATPTTPAVLSAEPF